METPSSVVERFIHDSFPGTKRKDEPDYLPEITTDIEGYPVRILFDVLDSLFVDSHTLPFGSRVNAILVVYDVSDKREVRRIESLLHDTYSLTLEDDIKRYLVGNKSYANEDERKISYEEGAAIAAEHGIPFYEVSSETGENINEMFHYIITKTFMKYRDKYPEDFNNENDEVEEEEEEKKGCVIC